MGIQGLFFLQFHCHPEKKKVIQKDKNQNKPNRKDTCPHPKKKSIPVINSPNGNIWRRRKSTNDIEFFVTLLENLKRHVEWYFRQETDCAIIFFETFI